MNKAEQVARVFGVELNEEFHIRKYGSNKFRIVEANDHVIEHLIPKNNNWCECDETLSELIIGNSDIEKIVYRPKYGEKYYFYDDSEDYDSSDGVLKKLLAQTTWTGDAIDYALWGCGNCFRTKNEALEKGKKLLKTLQVLYEEL